MKEVYSNEEKMILDCCGVMIRMLKHQEIRSVSTREEENEMDVSKQHHCLWFCYSKLGTWWEEEEEAVCVSPVMLQWTSWGLIGPLPSTSM